MTGDDTTTVDPAVEAHDAKMTIWEHLAELRSRVVKVAIALLVGLVVAFNFAPKLYNLLMLPYDKAYAQVFDGKLARFQTLETMDLFTAYLQLALFAAVIMAAPIIFYQLWGFISPGLYAKEKRFVIPFVLFSTTLFLGGVAFCYYIALPAAFSFNLTLHKGFDGKAQIDHIPTIGGYLDFCTRMLLALGFCFELPLLIAFLSIAGIVTTRQLVKFSRWAVLVSFILGAIITPGGEISFQAIVSGALIGLYFLSILVSMFVVKRKKPEPAGS